MQEIDLATHKPDLRKILLIGNEGTGKTRFIGTMPKPICICSFDKGINTLAGIEEVKAYVFMDENRYQPKAWAEFSLFYKDLKAGKIKYKGVDGKEVPYQTIAIDSLTALSKFILDHAMYINNNVDGKGSGDSVFASYRNTKSFLEDVVTTAVYGAPYTVCTAILEAMNDKLTGQIFFLPSTEGKFREEAGQWFDVVGFMSVDVNPATKKPKFIMDLVGDRTKKAKIRIPSDLTQMGLVIENPSYPKLLEIATNTGLKVDPAKTK